MISPIQPQQRFGRLVALEATMIGRHGAMICRCDCGRTKTVRNAHLRGGMVRSCGCLAKQLREAYKAKTFGRPTDKPTY